MAHDEVRPRVDVAAAVVALEDEFGALQQQRRLGGVLFRGNLLQAAVKVFGYTQIHGHASWYQTGTKRATVRGALVYRVLDPEDMGVADRGWPQLLVTARRFGYDGLNITHPAKQVLMDVLDGLSDDGVSRTG